MISSPLLAIIPTLVYAQVPSYLGALYLQPGSLTSKCLRADNYDGAPVTISDCSGTADQQWTFTNGQVQIYGTKCLDVTNGTNTDGTKVQIYTCEIPPTAGINQQWYYTGYGDNHLQWTNQSRCLDLTNGNYTDGNQVQVWSCSGGEVDQVWDAGYMYNQLPNTSESGQSGTNACGTTSSQSSLCQTITLNDADDFCLWGPTSYSTIGNAERDVVAYCTKAGRGTRLIPDGTLQGVHFVRTGDYVQVTGVGDFAGGMGVDGSDGGGELDPHGADGNGNPVGGLVFGNTFGVDLQYHEWTCFISDTQFCIRACVGPNARTNCQHIYDEMGCDWNMPANYNPGVFESCLGADDIPMGVYGSSTWFQGVSPTPSAQPAASSSSCTSFASISVTNV